MPVIAAFPTWAIAAAGHYFHWGVISVSITNLLIVIAMLVLFGLALVVPFPGHRTDGAIEGRPSRGRWVMTTVPRAVAPPPQRQLDRPTPWADRRVGARGRGTSRQPAVVRLVVDLRVRGAHAGRPHGGARVRHPADPRGLGLVARLVGGPFRELAPPVERGAVLHVHGDPPVGEVLDGRLARQAHDDLGHRRRRCSSPRSARPSRAISRSPTSTRNGSAPRARTASTRSVPEPSSTC